MRETETETETKDPSQRHSTEVGWRRAMPPVSFYLLWIPPTHSVCSHSFALLLSWDGSSLWPILNPGPFQLRSAPNPEECGPSSCDCKCLFKLVHFHSPGSAVRGGSGTCRPQLMAEPPTWSQASLVVKRGITDGGTSGYLLSLTPRQWPIWLLKKNTPLYFFIMKITCIFMRDNQNNQFYKTESTLT